MTRSLAPTGLPLVGHALSFVRDKTGFLSRCRDEYGDCVPLNIGGPTWLLNDPAAIKHVLVESAERYEKTPKLTSERGRALSGSGLHTATGAEHVFLRRMVQPLFHKQIVRGHIGLVRDVAQTYFQRYRSGQTIDLLDAMLDLSQRVMLRALFGASFQDTDGRFAQAVTARRSYIEFFFTSNLPSPEYWPVPVVQRYRRARVHLHDVIDREIAARRRGNGHGDVNGEDWLTMLVDSTGRDGSPLTDAQIRDEAMTLTSTGYETVAAALTWSGHLLSQHPSVQSMLRADLQTASTASGTSDPPLLNMVLNESMRLFPPTWLYVRVAVADDVLPNGVKIARGDKIYLSPFTMHRHPAWFDRPNAFDPSRFSEAAARERPRFAFYPFGGGARLCLGEPFARMEMSLLLAELVRQFRLLPASDAPIRFRPSIVLEPRYGLPVRLERVEH